MNDGVNMSLPLTPAYGNNGGFGGLGGDAALLIIMLLCCGGGFGGFGGGNQLYPWLSNSNQMADGFQNQLLATQVMGNSDKISSGFGDVQTALCGGFAGVNATVNSVGNSIAQQLNNNQQASLQRSFDAQTAVTQGMNAMQAQFAQCCCDQRLATCQTQNLISNEAAATRAAMQSSVQTVLDKMCQQEIDALKRENENLRTMVNMQNLAASQTAQTAQLVADNNAQTQYIVNRVAPYPIPAYVVANPTTPTAAAAAA